MAAIILGGCRLPSLGAGGPLGAGLTGGTSGQAVEPLRAPVREAVATLLARHVPTAVVQASLETAEPGGPAAKRIAIVPVGDAAGSERDTAGPRLGAIIQQRIDESDAFESIAPRFVVSGLEAARLRPADLLLPEHRRSFVSFMEQQGQEVDYLIMAAIEQPDDRGGRSRDRMLTVTLVDAASGTSDECRRPLPAAGRGLMSRLPRSRPAAAD